MPKLCLTSTDGRTVINGKSLDMLALLAAAIINASGRPKDNAARFRREFGMRSVCSSRAGAKRASVSKSATAMRSRNTAPIIASASVWSSAPLVW